MNKDNLLTFIDDDDKTEGIISKDVMSDLLEVPIDMIPECIHKYKDKAEYIIKYCPSWLTDSDTDLYEWSKIQLKIAPDKLGLFEAIITEYEKEIPDEE